MDDLNLNHLVATSGGLIAVLTPIFAFYGKIKANITKGLVSESDLVERLKKLEDKFEDEIAKAKEEAKQYDMTLDKKTQDNGKDLAALNATFEALKDLYKS